MVIALRERRTIISLYGAFPPAGAGRFGAGREGAVLFRSVTCRVSTADSGGRGLSRTVIAAAAT